MSQSDDGGRDWHQLAAEAEQEAARCPLKREHEARVRAAIESARVRLGGDGVDNHTVSFTPAKWAPVLKYLPAHCIESGTISRGEIFKVAGDRDAEGGMWRLFVASYVWGQGDNGYGLARLEKIRQATPEESLTALMRDAFDAAAVGVAMAGYGPLRGEHRTNAAAKGWGAAFFTKALYFGLHDTDLHRPALVLDAILASAVTELSELPWLLYRGRAFNWSAYRYGVYLAWMGQTAEAFEVSPDLLEYALFKM